VDAKATRLRKEIRPLFWPWCAITLAGAVPFFHPPDEIAWIPPLAFLLGIPLLATLSYGSEFQHRTFSLLLSQPVSRGRIWREKMLVTLGAALSAVLLFALSSGRELIRDDPQNTLLVGAWTVAIVASATFWTLLSRSTVGGVILNISAQGFVIIAGLYGYETASTTAQKRVSALLAAAVVGYAGAMLWFGWRKLARIQATGGMAGDDLLVTGPDVLPQAFAAWFRCRPRGATLNLIRKELRLLRPVWLCTLLSALGWTALSVCEFWGRHKPYDRFPVASAVVGVACAAIIALLAGSISLGEEKTSGRHAWHMTLPVSAWRQWIIKLVTALFAGLVCAGLLPLLLMAGAAFFYPSIFPPADKEFQLGWLFVALLLTAEAFWCSCAASGTVAAVLWVFPALIATVVAPATVAWMVNRYAWPFFLDKISPNLSFGVAFALTRLGSSFQETVDSVSSAHPHLMHLLPADSWGTVLPTLIAATIQSYRLFRRPLSPSAVSVIRKLTVLVFAALLGSLLWTGWWTFTAATSRFERIQVAQTDTAIQDLLAEIPHVEAGHPLEFTDQDILDAHLFSDKRLADTLHWLRNVRITVIPLRKAPQPQQMDAWYFVATIRVASGTELTLSERPSSRCAFPDSIRNAQVRWPGADQEEPLWIW
jgi:ABC-type transport system involved in multi-copper enzyme maturation permease subunit